MLDVVSTQAVFHILHTAENSISQILGKRIRLLPQEAELSNKQTPETMAQKDFQLRAIICQVNGVSWNQITAKTRKREVVVARQLYCYYAKRRLAPISLKSIGENVGGRDHTTAIHSIQTIQNLIDTRDEGVVNLMEQINEKLLASDGIVDQLNEASNEVQNIE